MKKKFLLGAVLLTAFSLAACKGNSEKLDTKKEQETSSEVKKDGQQSEELSVSNKELKESSKKINHYIQMSYSKMQDVWPTVDANNFNIFITNGNEVYFANEDKQVLNEDFTEEMKDIVENTGDSPGSFGKFDYNGNSAVMMVSEKESEQIKESEILRTYETATHELFHSTQGNEWKHEETNSRSAEYPQDAMPRKYRNSMVKALRTAYHDNSKKEEALQEFNYWYNKWENEYPEEVKSTKDTDILEGTAEYFGMSIAGKATNYNEVYKELENLPVLVNVIPQIDVEAYAIGFYAINLLKDSDKLNTDLMETYEETPAKQLHKTIADSKKEYSFETDLKNTIDKEINEKNKIAKKELGSIPEDYLNGKLTYLKAAPEMDNSVGFSSFVSVKGVDGEFGLNTQGALSKGITATNSTMLRLPDGYLAFPIDEDDIKENKEKTLVVNSPSYEVSDKVKFEKTKDEFGNVVYQEKN